MKENIDKVLEVTQKLVGSTTVYRCANCSWHTHDGMDLEPCKDLNQRLEAGDTMPDGDCPQCGAFCYAEQVLPIDMEALAQLARDQYAAGSDNTIEIDPLEGAEEVSCGADGIWVRAWVLLSNEELEKAGITNPEAK